MPTFIFDYERGFKGVFGSSDEHERMEFEVQQKIKLNQIRSLSYRAGVGLFTKVDNIYFVDFVNFRRSNIPEGWNDEIGGTFHLLVLGLCRLPLCLDKAWGYGIYRRARSLEALDKVES